MNERQAKDILTRYHLQQCTDEEKAWVEAWYLDLGKLDEPLPMDRLQTQTDRVGNKIKLSTFNQIKPSKNRRLFWPSVAAAVLLIGAFGAGIWYTSNSERVNIHTDEFTVKDHTNSNSNRAFLKWGDGRIVELDEGQHGIVIVGDGVVYDDEQHTQVVSFSQNESAYTEFVELQTPKGSTFQVTLLDGTQVWLNASTTFRYPQRFAENERVVELEGEAFFDVAQLKKQKSNDRIPFKVKALHQLVEVAGTSFNIMAYPGGSRVQTTLLSGVVRVKVPQKDPISLVPGEQTVWSPHQNTFQKKAVHTAPYIAWMNNFIAFEGDDIKSVMDKLVRWYDVEVQFEGPMPEDTFGGQISRSEKLSDVLKFLEGTGKVQFQQKGRRIIVMQ